MPFQPNTNILSSLFTTFTTVFEGQYGFPTSTSGLAYLGWGIGSIVGQVTYTMVSNRYVARSLEKGNFKPEHRLPLLIPGGIFLGVGLIWYGWSAQAQVHWMVPIIGTAFGAFGLTIIFVSPEISPKNCFFFFFFFFVLTKLS